MTMWRRVPPGSKGDDEDRARVAVGMLLIGLALMAALLIGGCLPKPECALGTFPVRVDSDSSSSGSAAASGTAISGKGAAAWKGAGSVDWSCARICTGGQLLKASQDDRRVSVECLAPVVMGAKP